MRELIFNIVFPLQMSDMIEGYIELAATNAPKEANDMPFPAGLRRSKQ